jgi:hypothetical protein
MKFKPLADGQAQRTFQLEEAGLFLAVPIMSPEIEDPPAVAIIVFIEEVLGDIPRAVDDVSGGRPAGAIAACQNRRSSSAIAGRGRARRRSLTSLMMSLHGLMAGIGAGEAVQISTLDDHDVHLYAG